MNTKQVVTAIEDILKGWKCTIIDNKWVCDQVFRPVSNIVVNGQPVKAPERRIRYTFDILSDNEIKTAGSDKVESFILINIEYKDIQTNHVTYCLPVQVNIVEDETGQQEEIDHAKEFIYTYYINNH